MFIMTMTHFYIILNLTLLYIIILLTLTKKGGGLLPNLPGHVCN